jgi:dUTP pyrophosphatase
VRINFKKLNPNAISPYRATKDSACADLHACLDKPLIIEAGECGFVPTGIAVELPQGYGGFMFVRSSFGKRGLSLANGVGVIDADYRGEIGMLIMNHSDKPVTVNNGDRPAQLAVMPVALSEFVECDELSDTDRGVGGFGSTG